jgi:8-oxo-dGTP pyrophosphatase MutT (NUDIX family)
VTPADVGETDILPAQPAATVMVVRDIESDAGPGLEVFVLRRTSGAAFAAGMFVFPGGRVDAVDGGLALEPFVHGMDDAEASRQLDIDQGGLAFWVAAIRECFEESGLLLARRHDGTLPEPDPTDRVAVHRGELSMIELCRKHDIVLDAGALRYVAHWVTPVGETPRRFDTRFFLAAVPHGQDGVHDDAETVDSRWVRPADALREAERGTMVMMPPTIANLTFLDGCSSVAEALSTADAAGLPPRVQPKIRRDTAGRFVDFAMPGDPDYDALV